MNFRLSMMLLKVQIWQNAYGLTSRLQITSFEKPTWPTKISPTFDTEDSLSTGSASNATDSEWESALLTKLSEYSTFFSQIPKFCGKSSHQIYNLWPSLAFLSHRNSKKQSLPELQNFWKWFEFKSASSLFDQCKNRFLKFWIGTFTLLLWLTLFHFSRVICLFKIRSIWGIRSKSILRLRSMWRSTRSSFRIWWFRI